MATSVLSPAVLPFPTTSPSSKTDAALGTTTTAPVQTDDFYTIDGLLRARAAGETANEPIVAYPSSATNYIYYTPLEVCVLQNYCESN